MSKPAIEAARTSHTGVPWQERLFLLKHVTGSPVAELILNKTLLSLQQEKEFLHLLKQRETGAPLAVLVGSVEFLDFKLLLTPWVFIPRPETEQLLTRTLEELDRQPEVILELGTGTGALAIALAKEFPGAAIIATDLSPIALRLAKHNAENLGVSDRIRFIKANLFEFEEARDLKNNVDLLISNPPYIPTDNIPSLPPEVNDFDPPLALNGGPDGFRVVDRILNKTKGFLASGGLAAIEIDPALAEPLDAYAATSLLHFMKGVDNYGNLRFLFVRCS